MNENHKLFMETTSITPEKTSGQIQESLSRYGAQAIMTEFSSGKLSAISFRIEMGKGMTHFKLPCRWEQVYKLLERKTRRHVYGSRKDTLEDKARRIAWRQIYRWVESQLALVQTSMVQMQEVFLPYLVDHKGQTLYEKLESKGFSMIEDKRDVGEEN